MTGPVVVWAVGLVVGVAATGFAEPLPASVIGAGLVGCVALAPWWRALPVGFAGILLGQWVVSSLPEGPDLAGPVVVQGVVVSAAQGQRVDLAVTRWAAAGESWTESSGRIRLKLRDPPRPGTPLVARGRAGPVVASILPGAPDPVRSARLARIQTELAVDHWRPIGSAVVTRAVRDPTGVLRALTLGDRAGVSQGTWARFRGTGTAHLLSISGFHVGVVAGAVGWIALRALRLAAIVRPVGLPDWPALGVGVLAAVAYTVIAGAPISAQRATGLVALIAVGRAWGRRIEVLPLLGLVAVVIVVVDPPALASPSMQLSFGAIVGLVRVTPALARWVPPDLPRPVAWLAGGLATSVGATVGTLPAAAWWFQEVAPLSLFANLFAVPWTGFVIQPLAALAVFGPTPVAEAAALAGTAAVELLLWALAPFDVPPWTPAVGPTGAIALVGLLVWPRRLGRCVSLLAVALGVRDVPVGDTAITFLDVGQGDAALVERRGERWLVDGGPPGPAVLQWLRRVGIRRLDVVVATHGQRDHVGGLLPVLQGLEVGELWYADEEGLEALLDVARARGVGLRRLPLMALHPPPDFEGAPNDRSLVLAVDGVLLTGDLERRGEQALLDLAPDVRVLKVGHHGSRTSSSPAFLDRVAPEVAVISVGRDNRYRHPDPGVLDRLAARARVWRTDRDGTVEVRLGEDAVRVRSWRAGWGWSSTTVVPAVARAP